MSSSFVLPFNDTSPAFTYQPADAWFSQPWNASNVGQTGTFHFSDNLTAIVTFTFPDPAIAFSYFGFRRSSGGLYELCVDCTPGAPNFVTVDAFNATDDGNNPPVLLYNQGFASPGIHTITIHNIADSRGPHPGDSELTMDRIELTISNSPSVVTTTFTASSTPTLTTSSSTSAVTTTFTGSNTTTMSSTTAASSSTSSATSSSPPIGAIVGAVVGALALLIGASVFLYCRRLRRTSKREDSEASSTHHEILEDPSSLNITPFHNAPVVSTPPVMSSTGTPWGEYILSTSAANEKDSSVTRNMPQTMRSTTSIATSIQPPLQAPSFVSETVSRTGSTIPSGSAAPESELRQRESDAGPLLVLMNRDSSDILPPEYGKVFSQQT